MHRQSELRTIRTISTLGALALALAAPSARADDGPTRVEASADAAPQPTPPQPAAKVDDERTDDAPSVSPKRAPSEEEVYLVDDESRPPLPYRDGVHVPRGFRLDASPRYALVVAGASTSGALWVISTIAAIGLDKKKAVDGDPNFDDMYWPMFIPVVGPFISIGTANASGTGAGILALDGAFQAGGLALMISGLAAPKVELIPQKSLYLTAEGAPGVPGLGLGGSF
jgi:hypothetical protein